MGFVQLYVREACDASRWAGPGCNGKASRKLLGLSYCSRTLLQSFDAVRSTIRCLSAATTRSQELTPKS
ncbi:hypothetical protein IG631_16536 [Alternaria alternata]|nr:hypothetical protein IG631_16536 [Alternaria alternata]